MSEIEATPRTQIPRFSRNASPEAMHVALNPEQGAKPSEEQLAKYSRRQPTVTSAELERIGRRITGPSPTAPRIMDVYADATGEGKFEYWLTKFKQEAINRYARLEKLYTNTPLSRHMADSSAMAAAVFADRSRGIVAAALKYGVVIYRDGAVRVERLIYNRDTGEYYTKPIKDLVLESNEIEFRGLIDVMGQLRNTEYGDLTEKAQQYAIVQRSSRIDAQGKDVPIGAQERDSFNQEIRRLYGNNVDTNPILKWHRDWQAYNNYTIQFLKDTGMLTDETAQVWQDYSDYFPFYRAAEGDWKTQELAQKVFSKDLTSRTHIRPLKGGKDPINMPMEEAVSFNLTAAIDMGMKNIAQQRIVRDMVELGLAAEKGTVQSVAPTARFRVRGKDREFHIYDPLIHESMLPLDGDGTMALVRMTLGKPATWLRELITRDPGFMAANLMRDTLSAYVTSGSNFIPMVDTGKGFMEE
ncbi:MAG: hypothetical protein JSU65_04530, partial [Candidatus Zixiibacteriota bacterium]